MMMPNLWFKIKIINCVNTKDYWYADMIGKEIMVKEPYSDSWGYETRTGQSIFKRDAKRT